jgi:zinc transporter ZupT
VGVPVNHVPDGLTVEVDVGVMVAEKWGVGVGVAVNNVPEGLGVLVIVGVELDVGLLVGVAVGIGISFMVNCCESL